MDDKTENRDDDQAGSPDNQGKVNGPLTRSDVEAPRVDFEGRTPKDD